MLSQFDRELEGDITAESLQAEYGQSVLLLDTRPLPLQLGRGTLRARPESAHNGPGVPTVEVEVKAERPDTREIVWFGAHCGGFVDGEVVLAEFVAGTADWPSEGVSAYDDLVELAPGTWWQPPLLSFAIHQMVWPAPIRLARLVQESGHFAICQMKYLRLDGPGYFELLPKCLAFLATWVA
jgi:hypothetical protein